MDIESKISMDYIRSYQKFRKEIVELRTEVDNCSQQLDELRSTLYKKEAEANGMLGIIAVMIENDIDPVAAKLIHGKSSYITYNTDTAQYFQNITIKTYVDNNNLPPTISAYSTNSDH